VVGLLIRNRLGIDVYGTSASRKALGSFRPGHLELVSVSIAV
jgi:hypothetical protein